MRLKVSSAKRWPFCLGHNVLIPKIQHVCSPSVSIGSLSKGIYTLLKYEKQPSPTLSAELSGSTWIYPGVSLTFNGIPGNIRGNLDRYTSKQWKYTGVAHSNLNKMAVILQATISSTFPLMHISFLSKFDWGLFRGSNWCVFIGLDIGLAPNRHLGSIRTDDFPDPWRHMTSPCHNELIPPAQLWYD